MSASKTTDKDVLGDDFVYAGGTASEMRTESHGRIVGYARVSTGRQEVEAQMPALRAAGAVEVIEETVSGAASTLPLRDDLIAELVAGDELVVVGVDRLGRSAVDVLTVADDLRRRGVRLRLLREGVDTATAAGMMVLTVMAGMAQMERALIQERTRAGLAAARRRGARLGRPAALTAEGMQAVAAMHEAGATVAETAAALGVSRSVIDRARRRLRDEAAAAA